MLAKNELDMFDGNQRKVLPLLNSFSILINFTSQTNTPCLKESKEFQCWGWVCLKKGLFRDASHSVHTTAAGCGRNTDISEVEDCHQTRDENRCLLWSRGEQHWALPTITQDGHTEFSHLEWVQSLDPRCQTHMGFSDPNHSQGNNWSVWGIDSLWFCSMKT